MHLLYFIIVGLVAGWLAGKLVRGGGFGMLGDMCLGMVGSIVGGKVLDLADVHAGGIVGRLLTATLGAVLLLYAARFFRKGSAG